MIVREVGELIGADKLHEESVIIDHVPVFGGATADCDPETLTVPNGNPEAVKHETFTGE